jgi:UTP-glucose-1-phosphate uridylyltransferase
MINLKAVIPVAGLGMHMLPATKAIPKEMLPIVDKPMIQYIVDEIVAAGIKEIVLVTHSSKNAVENHFDTSYELEALLEQRVKRQLLAEVQSICPPGVTIMNVRQAQPLGLGTPFFVLALLWVTIPLLLYCRTSFWTPQPPIRCVTTSPLWLRVSMKPAAVRFWRSA